MVLDTCLPIEITLVAAVFLIWCLAREHKRTKQLAFRLIAISVAVYVFQLALVHYLSVTFLSLLDRSPDLHWDAVVIDLILSAPMAMIWMYFLWMGFSKLVKEGHWFTSLGTPTCPNPRCLKTVSIEDCICLHCGQQYAVERLLLVVQQPASGQPPRTTDSIPDSGDVSGAGKEAG